MRPGRFLTGNPLGVNAKIFRGIGQEIIGKFTPCVAFSRNDLCAMNEPGLADLWLAIAHHVLVFGLAASVPASHEHEIQLRSWAAGTSPAMTECDFLKTPYRMKRERS
jgi:hypothetical protein